MSQKPWQIRDRRVGGPVGTPEDKVSVEDFPFAVCMSDMVTLLVRLGGNTAGDLAFTEWLVSSFNTTSDDIARAVKCALVGNCTWCNRAFKKGELTLIGTTCDRTGMTCESVGNAPIDPLQCPLVRRVLDVLGMSATIPKSGDKQP